MVMRLRSSRCNIIAFLSRPAGTRCSGADGQHLAGSGILPHALGAAPLLRDDEQRAAIGTTERAREAAPVALDRVEHLAALANTHAAPVADIGVPDSAVSVQANPVRMIAGRLRPRAPVAQTASPSISNAVSRSA